jgi:hypothetical protein
VPVAVGYGGCLGAEGGKLVQVDVVGAQGMLGKIFADAAVAEEFFAGACYFHCCCSLLQT